MIETMGGLPGEPFSAALRNRSVRSCVGGIAAARTRLAGGEPGRRYLRPRLGLEPRLESMRFRASRRKWTWRTRGTRGPGGSWWTGGVRAALVGPVGTRRLASGPGPDLPAICATQRLLS